MTDREKAIVMAYTGVAMLTGDKLGEYYKYCSELLGHPAYTHEVFSKDISERAKNDFIKLCKEEDEYRWHDLRKEPDELPAECTPVLVTWVNHNPVSYYSDIKDKPFSDAMGVYCEGKWWWWSSDCIDYLQEYGESKESDKIDKYIEIIAWKEIEPFGGEDDADL